ncbi:MAG: polysaccharide deacetylase family protein, partial [Clostridia bacterium]|nr:polysaccharide deacetylase family protein [Clostridia bacterium]
MQKRGTFRNKCRFFVCFLALISLLQGTPVHADADTEIYRSVKTDSKQIAITFDDGPHPHLTERILDILDRYNAKAPFF